ncbi:MAG: hypothetical protein RL082_1491, partial [Pseudomonadota bacterium]
QRISRREPLAYLLGEAWLMGIPFDCTPQSIIPRSFIAELIVHGELDPWLPADGKVLDLCTGNGSLAILTALHYPDLRITASDLSLPALALAARNVERHHVSNQVELLHGRTIVLISSFAIPLTSMKPLCAPSPQNIKPSLGKLWQAVLMAWISSRELLRAPPIT